MVAPVEERTTSRFRPSTVRGVVTLWTGLAIVVVILFVVTVAILSATVYSAGGFVRSYLDAIDRGDTRSALALAGVVPSSSDGDDLLAVPSRGGISNVDEVSDRTNAAGTHVVTVTYRAAGADSRRTTRFSVARAGTTFGLFPAWRFTETPSATVAVTVEHDPRFTANGVQVVAPGADVATRYTTLVPAVVDLSHSTKYLTAATTRVVVTSVGAAASGSVDVEARASFDRQVQADVTKFLRTSCLPQKVLLPTGCPFGEPVDDRVTEAPTWTMVSYPTVGLVPTSTNGVWKVDAAPGVAHVEVGAESLFDGHDYEIDKDVPFTASYTVTLQADGSLKIAGA